MQENSLIYSKVYLKTRIEIAKDILYRLKKDRLLDEDENCFWGLCHYLRCSYFTSVEHQLKFRFGNKSTMDFLVFLFPELREYKRMLHKSGYSVYYFFPLSKTGNRIRIAIMEEILMNLKKELSHEKF